LTSEYFNLIQIINGVLRKGFGQLIRLEENDVPSFSPIRQDRDHLTSRLPRGAREFTVNFFEIDINKTLR